MRIVDLVGAVALPALVGVVAALLHTPRAVSGQVEPALKWHLPAAAGLGIGLVAAAGAAALERTAQLAAGITGAAVGGLTAVVLLALIRLGGRTAAGVGLAVCVLLTVGGLTQVRLLGPEHLLTAAVYGVGTVVALVAAVAAARERSVPAAAAACGWSGIVLLLLPLVPGLGAQINGARAWIDLGPLTFQPAELARPLLVVGVALALLEVGPALRHGLLRTAAPAVLPVAVGIGLLAVLHRDLGPALVLGLSTVVLTVLMRPPRRVLLAVLGVAVGAAGAAYLLVSRLQDRVQDWLVPVHSDGAAENTGAALQAMARGGVWGTGLGRGRPDAVRNAHNDFVLTAVTEERGLVGATCVIVLLALVCLHLLRLPANRSDDAGRAAVLGLAVMTAVHALYVVLGSIGVVPLTGIVVPFVSAGGSAMLAAAVVVGGVVGATASRRSAPWPALPHVIPARRAFAAAWAVAVLGTVLVVLDSPVPMRELPALEATADRGRLLAADGSVLAVTVADGGEPARRSYPHGDLTASVLGHVTSTGTGRGLDRTTAAASRCTPSTVESLLGVPCPPADLVLGLDIATQQTAARALAGRSGEVVVLDVRDSSVVADYATPARGTDESRTTERTAPPGSTFKLVVAGAALETGVPTDTARQARYTPAGGVGTVPNAGDGTCGGPLTRAIATSCNTAFAELATRVGGQRLTATATAMGFGSADLTEQVPLVASQVGTALDDPDALARTGIGQQDVRATPLQMAVVAATIATGGERRPARHVLGRCSGPSFEAVPGALPQHVLAPSTASALTAGMREGVESGTATRLRQVSAPVAAKTGTAQTGHGTNDAWVVAFAPVDNPRVAVAVHVAGEPGYDPTGGRDAADVAVPVLTAALAFTLSKDVEHACGNIAR